jgi:structural maintenance of chromosome 4
LNELEHVPEKNEREIAELTAREEKLGKDLEKEKAGIERAMAGLKGETQELQDSKDKLQTQLIGLKEAVNKTKSVVSFSSLLHVNKKQLRSLQNCGLGCSEK